MLQSVVLIVFFFQIEASRSQESLDANDDLALVDWSKDRLVVQRLKHGRMYASAESGCEPADTDEQTSLSPARSEIARPMRVSKKASPAVKLFRLLRPCMQRLCQAALARD